MITAADGDLAGLLGGKVMMPLSPSRYDANKYIDLLLLIARNGRHRHRNCGASPLRIKRRAAMPSPHIMLGLWNLLKEISLEHEILRVYRA